MVLKALEVTAGRSRGPFARRKSDRPKRPNACRQKHVRNRQVHNKEVGNGTKMFITVNTQTHQHIPEETHQCNHHASNRLQ